MTDAAHAQRVVEEDEYLKARMLLERIAEISGCGGVEFVVPKVERLEDWGLL